MTGRRLLPCGEQAVLVGLDGLEEVLGFVAAVRAAIEQEVPGFAAVTDVVPAASTVLVLGADDLDLTGLRTALAALEPPVEAPADETDDADEVEIEVRYDGPDLPTVAERTGLSTEEVVAAHTGTPWRVAFGGFAPGFAYLSGGDPRLRVPRRDTPRTAVPPGSVGVAGEFSAVYPRASPGGWQLIGQTDAVMFDVDRNPPALLAPDQRVRFVSRDQP